MWDALKDTDCLMSQKCSYGTQNRAKHFSRLTSKASLLILNRDADNNCDIGNSFAPNVQSFSAKKKH